MNVEDQPPGYPLHWEADTVLADGATARVRPIRPDDHERLARFHRRQSQESIYFRYFTYRPELTDRELTRLSTVDYIDRMAFVAEDDTQAGEGELMAVALYERLRDRDDAEVAFTVDDTHHGRGLATLMLEYLAARAREVGLAGLTAMVLPDNRRMLSVFKKAGFAVSSHWDDGIIGVDLGIEPTEEGRSLIAERGRAAGSRSVGRILEPDTVALIGASERPGTVGHALATNLLAAGGEVHLVNAQAPNMIRSVRDIEGDVDLAVIAVPADQVPSVVDECGDKEVDGLVVISAGFAETGPEGGALERDIVARARRQGMRLIGPNCLGVINTSVGLHATFSPIEPVRGPAGVISQSGPLGVAMLQQAARSGLGVSAFVALGNKADISANDVLTWMEDDDATVVVMLHLESFGNPHNFVRIARRLGRHKPLVAVAPAPTVRGGSDEDGSTIDTALDHLGVIRVADVRSMVDVARLLASQPVPVGDRVAVIGNSTGPVRLALRSLGPAGLRRAELGEATLSTPGADGLLTEPGAAIDLSHAADPEQLRAALQALVDDHGVDAVVATWAAVLDGDVSPVRDVIAEVAASSQKPVVATLLPGTEPRAGTVPLYDFPEEAVAALGRMVAWATWRSEPEGEVPQLDRQLVSAARAASAALLADAELVEVATPSAERPIDLLAAAGASVARFRRVDSVDAAIGAATELGWPVVLKVGGLPARGPGESGGVVLDLHDEADLRASWSRLVERYGDALLPAVVQKQVDSGVNLAIEIRLPPRGPSTISLGLGGLAAPASSSPSARVLPLSDREAERLVAGSPVASLLPPDATRHVADLLVRSAALANAVPETRVLRLDPVIASGAGAVIVDARVVLAVVEVAAPEVRRLD